jgi:hypothetical protein
MSEVGYNNSLELIIDNNNYEEIHEGIHEGIICFIVFIAFLRFWIF